MLQFGQVFQKLIIDLRLKLPREPLVLTESLGVKRFALFQVSEVEMQCVESPVDLGQRVIHVPLFAAGKMGSSHVASYVGDVGQGFVSVGSTGESHFFSISNQQQRSKKKKRRANFLS